MGILEVFILANGSFYDPVGMPPAQTEIMETYRVKPEGMSLEEWYMRQGPITPPPSELELYQGPPGGWPVEPVVMSSGSGSTDVQFMPPPSPYEQLNQQVATTNEEYVMQQMRKQGFVQGEYGGWYKPSTQEERPITPPFVDNYDTVDDTEQLNNHTNGNGDGGETVNGESGLSMAALAIIVMGALAFS